MDDFTQAQVPGGKREPSDTSLWDAAAREFREETGNAIPDTCLGMNYVEYADDHHACRFYYARISNEVAATLFTGASPDSKEENLSWELPSFHRLRSHLKQGIRLVKVMLPRNSQGEPDDSSSSRQSPAIDRHSRDDTATERSLAERETTAGRNPLAAAFVPGGPIVVQDSYSDILAGIEMLDPH